MQITISNTFHDVCPKFIGGAILAEGKNSATTPELWAEIERIANVLRNNYTTDTIKEQSGIAATREAYRKAGKYTFNRSTEISGPISLAMIAERKGGAELGLNRGGGKLAVFGDEDFVTNSRFNALGNSMMALNTINWMFDDDVALNVVPRKVERYVLVLSKGEMKVLVLRFSILPLLVLALSFITYLLRRR